MSGKYSKRDDSKRDEKKVSDGDWLCGDPSCGNTNFARRDKCNKCGQDRPRGVGRVKLGGIELGKEMAEKSKGLFSADDWQCKSCGNVNWARRGTCNVCNAPKVGHIEERSGFGGGFMERDENPDKVQHDSDDDEYDEFGMRKKKFRGKSADTPPRRVEDDEEGEDEEEEDDEEEESGDEDLSKYAFDFDDDDSKDSTSKDGSGDTSRDNSDSRRRDGNSPEPARKKNRSRSRSPL